MNTSHFYRCIIAVPPKGKRGWNARIVRGGRVQWDGTWLNKRAAYRAWVGFAFVPDPSGLSVLRPDCIARPILTTQQRAKPIKRRKRK